MSDEVQVQILPGVPISMQVWVNWLTNGLLIRVSNHYVGSSPIACTNFNAHVAQLVEAYDLGS